MATHSSILAWRIPWTEEPGGLQSMGLQSRTQLSDFTFFSFLSLWSEVLQDEGKHETKSLQTHIGPSYLLIHFFKLQLSWEENT